jgi:glycosyltransferase involved in cell wall biosynthesis
MHDYGVDLVGDASLTPSWLRAHRHEVDWLHVHWRLDRLVDPTADASLDFPDARHPVDVRCLDRLADGLDLARSLGYRLAWTAHEIGRFRPDGHDAEGRIAGVLAPRTDVILVHDAAAASRITEWFDPSSEVVVAPIGHFAEVAMDGIGAEDVRIDLGVPADRSVLLAFGGFRTDKALPGLLHAFSDVADPSAVLLVAGDARGVSMQELEAVARCDDRILLRPGFVPDVSLRGLHELAAAAVLARTDEWTCSSLVLAASFGTPIVAADLPTTRSQIGPAAFWFDPGDVGSLTAALEHVLSQPSLAERLADETQQHVLRSTWDDMACRTAEALRQQQVDVEPPRRIAESALVSR